MRQQGFTLIELMITLVVIGILSAIAYPLYAEHLRTSERKACAGVLLTLGSAFEQQYAATGKYPGAIPANLPTTCPPEGGGAYTVSLSDAGDDTFTFTATPVGEQGKDACGKLTFDHKGVKGVGSGTVAGCW